MNGNAAGWEAETPGDEVLRGEPAYDLIGSAAERRLGTIYGFDGGNDRLIGALEGQRFVHRPVPARDGDEWADFRGFYIEPGFETKPDAVVWITETGSTARTSRSG